MPLQQLYPDPEATETHASPTVIDIIAVPGLGPPVKGEAKHAFDTWRTPSGQKGRLWLQHDLPDHVPDSRIFLYQYNTTAAYGQGLEDLRSKADILLEVINIERRDCPDIKILLLGHSMGGLLIKQALINASSNPGYSAIKHNTARIVFFATPHELSTQKLGEIGTAIATERGHDIRDELVRTLQAGAIFSELESWKHQALQYDAVSFWGSSDTIVTRNNVSLGLPGDVAKIVELDTNHRGISKFSNSDKDRNTFKIVVENIKRLCELAIRNPESQDAWCQDTSGLRHLAVQKLTARTNVMTYGGDTTQEPILQGIRYLNYQKPTIVQEAVLSALTLCPPRNVIASYPPGTGRTTALAIALLLRMDYHSATQPQALVIIATRLLVRQTEKCIEEVGRFCEGVVVETIIASSRPTAKVEANVIIATPGTFLDCIRRHLVDISQVRYLLMDDVDHVVDMQGSSDQCLRVTAVAQKSPETVQLLLFSDLTTPASKILNVMLRSNTLEKFELKGVELNANKIVHLVFRCSGEQQKLGIICKLPGVVTTSVLIIYVQ
ncbi:NB-ARC domain-containing protein, partial [Fusarium circinatum]